MEEQTPTATPEPAPQSAAKGFFGEVLEFIWETLKVVAISLVIILPVRYFIIQPFFVKGMSMVPNFQDKQYILVDKWTYRLGVPHRGDVVVFEYPLDPSQYFIKRIIGLPGESVLAGNNSVEIFNDEFPDGFTLNEKQYLPDSNHTLCVNATTTPYCGHKVTLTASQYFMMGDNREHSSDSRFFGPVNISFFSGMAWLRLWPLADMKLLPRTDYPPVQ